MRNATERETGSLTLQKQRSRCVPKREGKARGGFAPCTGTICLPRSAVKLILGNCCHAESTLQNCCTPSSHPNRRAMTKVRVHLPRGNSRPSLRPTSHSQEPAEVQKYRLSRKPPHFSRCWKVRLEKTVFPAICYSCPASIKCQNEKVLKMLLSK